MRSHPEFRSEPAGEAASHPVRVPSPPAEAADQRVEEYLDRVCGQLPADLTLARRREVREELRTHLGALVEAHRELGASEEEAVEAALRQFGDARRLAREWRKAAAPAPWKVGLASL